ncbi:MAG: alpha-E domain-containing protein [SAR324 cluster bacterium]|nr:alpha-E domain-containing protein [SAR324 cluster bacterium]
MLSRTANQIYWLSRYLERAENVARFIDVNLQLMIDLPQVTYRHWEAVVMTSGDIQLFSELFTDVTQKNVIQFLTFETENPNSILSTVRFARENARSVREIISSEMWEQINSLYLLLQDAKNDSKVLESPHDFFDAVKRECHLFEGITQNTLSRSEAWYFLRLGHFIERADKTARILDMHHYMPGQQEGNPTYELLRWHAVLKSISALEMYRQNYREVNQMDVYNFLLLDKNFPRSIYWCLIRAEESLRMISGSREGRYANKAERFLGKLKSEVDYCDLQELIEEGITRFLDNIQFKINEIDDMIYETFFKSSV